MNNEQVIKIGFSRTKTMLFLLPMSLIFVALGFLLLAQPSFVHQLVGLSSIVFFGACALVILKTLFNSGSALEISQRGIYDRSSGIPAGFIPWSDIQNIRETKFRGQSFITIDVRNPGDYSNRGNLIQRWMKKANIGLIGSPINISTVSLKVKQQELIQILHKMFDESSK